MLSLNNHGARTLISSSVHCTLDCPCDGCCSTGITREATHRSCNNVQDAPIHEIKHWRECVEVAQAKRTYFSKITDLEKESVYVSIDESSQEREYLYH